MRSQIISIRSALLATLVIFAPFSGGELERLYAQAPTVLRVCANNCEYNNTQLQQALDAANANTVILTQENIEYVGTFVLRAKPGASSTAIMEMRTGVDANGVVQPLSRYVPDNVRICPAGYSLDWYSCAGKAGEIDTARLSKFRPSVNNQPAIETNDSGSGTPVEWWKLRWIEVIPNSYGGGALVNIANETNDMNTGSVAYQPSNITLDQVIIRGDPVTGQYRGIWVEARTFNLTNSHFQDIKAVSEGQAMWLNGKGPYLIQNNYACCGTETVLTGGAGTRPEPRLTVDTTPAPTTTSVAVTGPVDDLFVEKQVAIYTNRVNVTSLSIASDSLVTTSAPHNFQVGWEVDFDGVTGCSSSDGDINARSSTPVIRAINSTTTFTVEHRCSTAGSGGSVVARFSQEITNVAGNVITWTPALPITPVAGDEIHTGVVLDGLTVRHNVFTHPASWFTSPFILAKPVVTPTTSTTGGSLAAGTYGYRVLARMMTAAGAMADSGAATEVTATTTGSTGRVILNWPAIAGATEYYVYGRTPGGQNLRWTVTTNTFTDTGTGGTSSSVDTSVSRWGLKNTFELKMGRNVLIEYNIIERSWVQGQTGACVLFTITQNGQDNFSSMMRDIVFRYNEVRHCNQSMQMTGTDARPHESSRAGRYEIYQNLFWDIAGDYGGSSPNVIVSQGGGPRQIPNRSVFDILWEHNTTAMDVSNDYNYAFYFANCDRNASGPPGSPIPDMVMRNNIIYSGSYGLASENPAQGPCTWVSGRLVGSELVGNSVFSYNAIAGASSCSVYTDDGPGNVCPSVSDLEANTFVGPTGVNRLNYRVQSTSTLYNAGSDGTSYGADIDLFHDELLLTEAGSDVGGGGPPPPPPPLTITTTSPLPTGMTTQPYLALIQGSGGVPPYTWTHVGGTRPTGIQFNPTYQTDTAALEGTPTTATTNRALTFRLTDSAAAFVEKTLYITVQRYTLRSGRYNWSEGAYYVRGAAPTNPEDQVRVGDIWFDTATSLVKKSVAIDPDTDVITWEPVGEGAGTTPTGARPNMFMFASPAGNFTWSLPTGAGGFYTNSQDIFVDLTDYTDCRMFGRASPTVGGLLWVRYNTANASPTTDLGPVLPMTAPYIVDSQALGDWYPIAQAARTFVRLSFWGRTTEASSETATLRNLGIVCR